MTRQVTDQLYIELDYFTPEEYFVYTAEAVADISTSATMSCSAGKVVEAASDLQVTTATTAYGARTTDIDLFAFSDAALTTAVDRIRDTNIAVSAQFDIATDFIRQRTGDSDVDSVFSAVIAGLRSRATSMETQAAFSLISDTSRFRDLKIDLSILSSLSVDVVKTTENISIVSSSFDQSIISDRIRPGDSTQSATATLSAVVNTNRDILLTVFSDVALSASIDKIVGYNADLDSTVTQVSSVNKIAGASIINSSQFTVSTDADYTVVITKVLQASFNLAANFKVQTRPTIVDINSGGVYDTAQFVNGTGKFGAASLSWNYATDIYPNTQIIYANSKYQTWGYGYVWSSTDKINWTRTATNITIDAYAPDKTTDPGVIFQNNTFLAKSGTTVYSSIDGITWTATTANASSITLPVYYGGYWWYYLPVTRASFVAYESYRATTLTGTWTLQSEIGSGGLDNFISNKLGNILSDGSVAFYSRERNDTSTIFYNVVTLIRGSSRIARTNWTDGNLQFGNALVANGNSFLAINQDGNSRELKYANGITNGLYRYNGGVELTIPFNENITSVSYANGYWFVNTSVGLYRSTDPAAGFTLVDSDNLSSDIVYANNGYYYQSSSRVLRYSSNTTSWADSEYSNISGLPGSLSYRNNESDLGTFKTLDFWLYLQGSSFDSLSIKNINGTRVSLFITNVSFQIQSYTNGLISLNITNSETGLFPLNQWNHVRISWNNTTVAGYINGVRKLYSTSWINHYASARVTIDSKSSSSAYYLDEVLFTDELLTDPGVTSFTVPTTRWENTPQTDLLLHFDNNSLDDSVEFVIPEARLISRFTQSISAIKQVVSSPINLNSQAQIYCLGQRSTDIVLIAFSNGTLSISVDKIKNADSQQSATFSTSISIQKITENIIDQDSAFTETANAVVVRDAIIDTDAIATVLAVAVKAGEILSSIDVTTAISVQAVKIARTYIFTSLSTTLTADGIKAVEGEVALLSDFAQSSTLDRYRLGSISVNTNASITIDTIKIADASAELASQFDITVDYSGSIIRIETMIFSLGTMSVSTDSIRDSNSQQSSEFTQSTIFDRSRGFGFNRSAAFTQSTINDRIRDNQIETDAIASTLTVGDKFSDVVISMTSTLVQATITDRIRHVDITANSSFNINIINDRIRPGSSDQSSDFVLSAEAISGIAGEAHLTTAASITVFAQKTTEILLIAFGNSTVSASVGRIRPYAMATAATTNISFPGPIRIRSGQIDTDAITSLLILGGSIFLARADLSVAFTLTSGGKILHIEDFVWKISPETRSRTISSETRYYKIRR